MINDPKRIAKGLWWDEAWRLTNGCTKVSAGCANCWAEREADKKVRDQYWGWNGNKVRFLQQNLEKPLKRKKPTVYAVWNDLFHREIATEAIDKAFAVMAMCPQHRFIVLTKRPDRASLLFQHGLDSDRSAYMAVKAEVSRMDAGLMREGFSFRWPLPNVIIGTSIENQTTANERIPHLLKIPAACRMVSYEPALGPVDFDSIWPGGMPCPYDETNQPGYVPCIHWVVMGCESGASRRPCKNEWVESAYMQCKNAGTPFFLKQWADSEGSVYKAPMFAVEQTKGESDRVNMEFGMGPCLELPEMLRS